MALSGLSVIGRWPVVSRMLWKYPSSGLRVCNVGSSQAARSRDIGTRHPHGFRPEGALMMGWVAPPDGTYVP